MMPSEGIFGIARQRRRDPAVSLRTMSRKAGHAGRCREGVPAPDVQSGSQVLWYPRSERSGMPSTQNRSTKV